MIFLSNYNLPKNVQNSLLDEVVFRVENLGRGSWVTEVTEVFKVWFLFMCYSRKVSLHYDGSINIKYRLRSYLVTCVMEIKIHFDL